MIIERSESILLFFFQMTKDKKNGTSTPVKVKSGGKTIKDIDLKDCPLTLERVHMADISKCTNFLKQNGDSIGIYYLIWIRFCSFQLFFG